MSSSGKVKLLVVVALLALGGGIGAYLAFGSEDQLTDEDLKDFDGTMLDAIEMTDDAKARDLQEKAERFRAILESRKRAAREQKKEEEAAKEDPNEGPSDGFSPEQERALQQALSRLYDPDEIKRVLSGQGDTGPEDFKLEIDRAFGEVMEADAIAADGAEIPLSTDMKLAMSRMNLLRSYSKMLMDAHSPDDPDGQWRAVERVNKEFSARFDSVNELYPFLDLAPVQGP